MNSTPQYSWCTIQCGYCILYNGFLCVVYSERTTLGTDSNFLNTLKMLAMKYIAHIKQKGRTEKWYLSRWKTFLLCVWVLHNILTSKIWHKTLSDSQNKTKIHFKVLWQLWSFGQTTNFMTSLPHFHARITQKKQWDKYNNLYQC